MEDLNLLSSLTLVDCSELKVVVKRNLQPKVFKDIEAIFIEAIYGGLLVSLSKSDYTFIIELLQNINEKFINTDKDLDFLMDASKEKTLKKRKSQGSTNSLQEIKNILDIEEETNIREDSSVPNISIKFYIDSIKMYLHDKESKMVKIYSNFVAHWNLTQKLS
jgi:hypothetical protein